MGRLAKRRSDTFFSVYLLFHAIFLGGEGKFRGGKF